MAVQTPTLEAHDAIVPLRLLSFNIQVGLSTEHYGHYFTRAWRHMLPGPGMRADLDRIAELISPYDFVALQEADAGSLRTLWRNQMEYLAHRAGFDHVGFTVTRDLRPVTRHCLGFLSRIAPQETSEIRLPSMIPGRRAMRICLPHQADGLTIVIAHLSLSTGTRRQQLDYLCEHLPENSPTILVGDLNCEPEDIASHSGLQHKGMAVSAMSPATYPSWRPHRRIDHILVSPHVQIDRLEALDTVVSDHLPLSADITVPR